MPIEKAKNFQEYLNYYDYSINQSEKFWQEEAERLDWIKFPTKIKFSSFAPENNHIKWFEDGVLNVCYNCVDRHLEKNANKTAIIWQGDNRHQQKEISFLHLHKEICKFANGLKSLGVKKGDRIVIYMPMIPEASIAMLACARIGAVHSVVFGGFSSEALANRINDCNPKLIITADGNFRGGKSIELKAQVDKALELSKILPTIIVKHSNTEIKWNSDKDIDYKELLEKQSDNCLIEPMNAEDPLFILYTSGSTGKPKGVLHTTGGYLLYVAMTHKHIFDIEKNDIYWCTADIGWITGHSYVVYGPLANGTTTIMFEGIPTWPDPSRYWQIIEEYKVNIFYTSPTALRSLIKFGDEHVKKYDLSTLKMLGSVGEPIDPTTWNWYFNTIGNKNCHIADTWWQTETGGIAITPLPITPLKPGSATRPFYGIQADVLEDGTLVIKDSWPGMMRDIYNDHERFIENYFSNKNHYYLAGDGAILDEDGYFWITGRTDDVLKVSGHRIGSAEIEGAMDKIPEVAESAVVGYPHEIKGEGIFSFIVLKNGFTGNKELEKKIIEFVRNAIGPIATIDKIQWTDQLPKTRSGKVMRRILRKIAAGDYDNLGDISTLTDPSIVERLILDAKAKSNIK